MRFVYFAVLRSTVLPTAASLPVAASTLRLPDQTTSWIFSKDWPFFDQPLMIWMRSRLPLSGSLTAQTTNVGALRVVAGKSAPIGTPLAYPALIQSFDLSVVASKSHPPKNRSLIFTPLVTYVSLRCIASNSDARVFSSAHTADS